MANIWTKIKNTPRIGLIVLVYIAFIGLGMPDGLMGVGWPSIRADFGIPIDSIGMLIVACTIGYMTSSFISGPVVTRFGVGRVLAGSCTITGLGLLGYTLVPQWWMMASLGVVAGLGAGAIDAGLNTYAAANFSEGLMQWLHASYGIGVTLGPVIMTSVLTAGNSWRIGYRIVGFFQILLGICFVASLSMWKENQAAPKQDDEKLLTDYKTPMGETLQQPMVWLSLFLFFLYVGGESALGTWAYSLLTEARGIDTTTAGMLAGSYWATFTIGRILGGILTRKVGARNLVLIGITGALLGSGILMWNPFPAANLIAVALIGFSIAPVFPSMMSGTSQRVGARFAANTIGMQMAMTGLGAAVIPSTMGVLARYISLETIPIALFVVYASLLAVYVLSLSLAQRKSEALSQA